MESALKNCFALAGSGCRDTEPPSKERQPGCSVTGDDPFTVLEHSRADKLALQLNILELMVQIETLKTRDKVVIPGQVSAEQRPQLQSNAACGQGGSAEKASQEKS